jgi:hypothetical protein
VERVFILNVTSMDIEVSLHFGALAVPLEQQLREQKLKFDKEIIKHLTKQEERISHLYFGDLLTETETRKVRDRLYKKILSHLKEYNKKRRSALTPTEQKG